MSPAPPGRLGATPWHGRGIGVPWANCKDRVRRHRNVPLRGGGGIGTDGSSRQHRPLSHPPPPLSPRGPRVRRSRRRNPTLRRRPPLIQCSPGGHSAPARCPLPAQPVFRPPTFLIRTTRTTIGLVSEVMKP